MADSAPKVSVIMPAYNAAAWISRAIQSILTQTFSDFELVLVDDGSTDATPEIMTAVATRSSRVCVEIRAHAGVSAASNYAMQIARGEYLARMDADDIALPDRFARQVAWLDQHPSTAVLGGWVVLIDGDDRKLRPARKPTSPDVIRRQLMHSCPIIQPTVMMRRQPVIGLGGYRSALDTAEDYDLWLRVTEHAEMENLPEVLAYYRLHPGQISQRHACRQSAKAKLAQVAALRRRRGQADPIPFEFVVTSESIQALDIDEKTAGQVRLLLEQAEAADLYG